MTARTVPIPPSFTAGMELTSTIMNQINTWMLFWSDPPMFSMLHNTPISVPNGVFTQIPMDTSEWDTDSGRAVATPWSYTIPVGMTGRWTFSYKVSWAVNNTGDRLVAVYKNGTEVSSSQMSGPPTTTSHNPENGSTRTIFCNAGDVMAVFALQSITGGGALNTSSGFFEGYLRSLASP